jgi:transposase, IS6 family
VHRQVKYLNNVVEADHGKLKQLIKPVRGFKTLNTAYATIKGFEVMRALRNGQAAIFNLTGDIRAKLASLNEPSGLGPAPLPKLWQSSPRTSTQKSRDRGAESPLCDRLEFV